MVLLKIKPLGWLVIVLSFLVVGAGAFVAARPKPVNTSGIAYSTVPPPFSTTAQFAHIPATDPSVATALSADNLDMGKALVGKPATFLGHAVKLYVPAGGGINLVNFAQKYKNAFSLVIEAKDYARFPDPNGLVGKQILVTGAPFKFKDQLEVKVESLDQIRIVDGTKAGK